MDVVAGKSVNAIVRSLEKASWFGGSPPAGNDNRWRYIPVRRLIWQRSPSKKQYWASLFSNPNDRSTWVRILSSDQKISSSLQWRLQRAGRGKTRAKHFDVRVGLGETASWTTYPERKIWQPVRWHGHGVRLPELIITEISHKMRGI